MGAWLHWPAALVAEADMHDAIFELAFGITGYWGMTYSLTAIVLFVPANQRLCAHAQMLLEACPEIEDPKKWLQEHGFTRPPWQHLGEISVLLAPLLAVPFGHLLSSLPG